MSAIDTQNAKQIRDPMDVLIELDVRDNISMTYSGYTSTAKVADGYLNNNWPMRKLADLQGDGFALDGTAKLYKFLYPNQVNGKLGVRGNVGQTLTVTASSTSTIKALSLTATNAASVTVGGTTTSIVGNQAIIQVNANSVTMTFNPADATHRIEVSAAVPGTVLTINNDNLIRATVSLRSDLSLYGQTLPESELNVDVYNDMDISEAVASIAEDVPITYQAGYPGDMSSVRKFYVSGQVTWKDNVLSIHAVDAVHFLNNVSIDVPQTESANTTFINIAYNLLDFAGIDYTDSTRYFPVSSQTRWLVKSGHSSKDFIAFCNNYLNITDEDGYPLDGSDRLDDPLQFCFVDGGIPTLYSNSDDRDHSREINEEDCADFDRIIGRPVTDIDATITSFVTDTVATGDTTVQKVGTATWVKNVGATLNFEKYAKAWAIGLYLGANYDNEIAQKLTAAYGGVYSAWKVLVVTVPAYAGGSSWNGFGGASYYTTPYRYSGQLLPYTNIPQEVFGNQTGYKDFSVFVPWNTAYQGTWNYDGVHTITSSIQSWNMLVNAGIIRSEATTIDLDIYGAAYDFETKNVQYSSGGGGIKIVHDDLPVWGRISARLRNSSNVQIYPEKMLSIPMYRSNVAGSFKWKGDPRMQPREIVTLNRLDGTSETITLENITLTHEQGGTSAEITYREGVI